MGALPLCALTAILFGLSFWGPYVHVLGGGTNLAPLYAFVVGVLVHFKRRKPRRSRQSEMGLVCGALHDPHFLHLRN